MINLLKIVPLILLTVFLSSCNDDGNKVSYPEITGVGEEVMLIKGESVNFELAGGDKKFKVESSNTSVASVQVKDKMLMITAGETTGMAEITIKSADKMKMVKVKVMETPEEGVYMGTEQKAALKNSVKNSKGMWLVEVAGNPYNGKRIFVPVLPQNLEKDQEIQIEMMSFGVDGMDEKISKAMVEAITKDIVKLKVGEYSIVVPRG